MRSIPKIILKKNDDDRKRTRENWEPLCRLGKHMHNKKYDKTLEMTVNCVWVLELCGCVLLYVYESKEIISITAIFSLCLKDFTGMNNKMIYNVCVSMSIAMRGGMKKIKGAKSLLFFSVQAMEKYDRNRIINIYICIFMFMLLYVECSMILLLYVILY